MKIFLLITFLIITNLSFKLNALTYSKLKEIKNKTGNSHLPDSVREAWAMHYTGPGDSTNNAYSIAVDNSDNVYITGGSLGLGGSNDYDIATIKYNTLGVQLWVARYNGPGKNWDIGRALTVDTAGNIYVTGETYSDSTYFNYVTIKYDAEGVQQWVTLYDGPSNNDDGATAIAVDDSGNVYVTGHSWKSETSWDYTTIKYNSSGEQLWVSRYNGPGNIADFAIGLAIDPLGNVYVTGTSDDLSVNFFPAYATVKYNSEGVEQWAARYNILWSYATDIAADVSGNVYVTGYSFAPGTIYDYATVKYNTMGVEQWVARYNGPGNADDYAYGIAIDSSGNVYVTGEAFFEAGAGSDYATVKYNASGIEQWVGRYNGSENSSDIAAALIVDMAGNVYVTGVSRGNGSNDDYATIKYNTKGIQQWTALYNNPRNSFDLASDLAVDKSGNVYVTGNSIDVGWSVYTTIKYEQTIIPVELTSFIGIYAGQKVELKWITATELNNKGFEIMKRSEVKGQKSDWQKIGFIRGIGTATETNYYYFIDEEVSIGKYFYRLKQIDFNGSFEYSNIIEVYIEIPNEFSLSQNYPNPFNPYTQIRFSLLVSGNVTLQVYNSTGQLVKTIQDGMMSEGSYEYQWDATNENGFRVSSGIYFYRINVTGSSSNFTKVNKMILLK